MAFKMKNAGGCFKMMGSSPSPMKATAEEMRKAGVSEGTIKLADKARSNPKMDNDKWAAGNEAAKKNTGGTSLNDLVAKRKTLEKGSNAYNINQNAINKALGNSKRYDVTPTEAAKGNKIVDGQEVKKGLGAEKGKTLTPEQKSAEKTNISIEKDKIAKAKEDVHWADWAKNNRDEAQMKIGDIRGGGDNAKTGTVVSRVAGRVKSKVNKAQLALRAKKANKKVAAEGKVKGSKAPKGTTYDPSDDSSNKPV